MVKFSVSLLLTRACFALQSHAVTTSIIGVFSYLQVCLMASVFGPHGVIQLNGRSFPHIAQIIAGFRLNGPSTEHLTHSQLIRAVVVRLRKGCCALCCLHVTDKYSLGSVSEHKVRNSSSWAAGGRLKRWFDSVSWVSNKTWTPHER